MPAPAGSPPGEYYAPTQPTPTRPPAYDVQGVTEDALIDFTPELRTEAVKLIANYRTGGTVFEPPSEFDPDGTWGTIIAPSMTGGTNWPGGCHDPETGLVYVYSKSEAQLLMLRPSIESDKTEFPYVQDFDGEDTVSREGFSPGKITVQGLPLLKPPYGRLTAIDLKDGSIAWQVAHGETPDAIRNHPALEGLEIPRTGQAGQQLGPTVTKSLVICGEAIFTTLPSGDQGAMLRAYDKATGEEVGAVEMPAPQAGAAMTYMLKGRQYIVLAIGRGHYEAEYVAYRLSV